MGKPKNPELTKLLAKPVKNKLKRFTSYKSKVSPKVLQTKSMRGMKVKNQLQTGYTKRSLTTASGGAGKDDYRPDPKILGKKPITKEEVRKATLKVKAERKSALEKQMKVPGYAQTKASKKAMAGNMVAREYKISLTLPFKTVGDQKKVINKIKTNVQIRQLNKTLLGTEKATNYKTPPALSKEMSFKRKHTLLPDTRYPYTMGKTKEGKLHNLGSSEYKKLQEYKGKTRVGYTAPGKLKKVKTGKILKDPDAKVFAQDVKSYVKQKEKYEKKIKQEKAAGRLGTKIKQIIKGFNKPKRGK